MKRICSLLLCFVMITALCPVLASTETVISVAAGLGYDDTVNHSAVIVTPEITVTSGDEPAGYAYQWYYMKDGTTEWVLLPWETGSSFVLSTNESGGWVSVDITPLDADGNAIGAVVEKACQSHTWALKGVNGLSTFTYEVGQLYQNTPAEYSFEVDGVKFILLDILGDGNYYVMMEDGVQKMAFDPDGTVIFDPADENNIAYWLNNDFLNGNTLPADLKNYIVEGTWVTESPAGGAAGGSGAQYWNQYSKTAKVGLLSASEFMKYLGRFGLWLSNYQSKKAVIESGWTLPWDGDSGFWLRTSKGDTNNQLLSSQQWGWVYNDAGAGSGDIDIVGSVTGTNATVTTRWARPTFRLSNEFFKNVKVENFGEKVREILTERYKEEELYGAGYSRKELAALRNTETVTIESVSVAMTAENSGGNAGGAGGKTLTANVTLADGATHDYYTYQWWYQINGTWCSLPTEINQSMIVGTAWPSYTPIRVYVTPTDAYGNIIGEAVMGSQAWDVTGEYSQSSKKYYNKDTYAQTPAEYAFTVDGKRFSLLDWFTHTDTETFYVLAEDSYGTHAYDTGDDVTLETADFDYSRTTNISYWLNNDFLTEGNGGTNILPQAIKDNLTEHTWYTGQNSQWKQASKATPMKVALLTRYDFTKYYGRFGTGTSSDQWNGLWWLSSCATNNTVGPYVVWPWYGTVEGQTPANENLVRPAFFLKKDFFTTYKLDLDTTGSKVKEMLAKRYTKDELAAVGYTNAELASINIAWGTYNYAIPSVSVSGNTVDFCVTYINELTTETKSVIIALYSGEQLVDLKTADVTVWKDETVDGSVIFESDVTFDSVKVFCWNGWDSLVPDSMPGIYVK